MAPIGQRILLCGGGLIAAGLWLGAAKYAAYAGTKDMLLQSTRNHFFLCEPVTPDRPGVIRTFPVVLAKGDADTSSYQALVDAGLVKRLSDQIYDLTEAGKKFYWPYRTGFCAFHIVVDSMDAIGEPEQRNGHLFRKVTFSYRARFEEWAKQPAIQKAFEKQFPSSGVQKTTLLMVLTDISWSFVEPKVIH